MVWKSSKWLIIVLGIKNPVINSVPIVRKTIQVLKRHEEQQWKCCDIYMLNICIYEERIRGGCCKGRSARRPKWVIKNHHQQWCSIRVILLKTRILNFLRYAHLSENDQLSQPFIQLYAFNIKSLIIFSTYISSYILPFELQIYNQKYFNVMNWNV